MMKQDIGPPTQRGAALVSVIFLIVTVSALAAFAVRTGMDYDQQATLALQEVRTDAAAYSGVEYAVNRINANPTCAAVPATLTFPTGTQGMTGISVALTCNAPVLQPSVGRVFEIVATARSGAFGNPDFVQRTRTRRVSNISGSWQPDS